MTGRRPLATRLLAMAFVLVPWAWAKLAATAAAGGLLGATLARGIRVERRTVAALAAAVFWIAHVASPYWLLAPSPGLRLGALAALAGLAAAWAALAATEVHSSARPLAAAAPFTVVAVVALLSAPGLGAPLEFRGDEDFHVGRALGLLERVYRAAGETGAGAALAASTAVVAAALWPRVAAWAALALLAVVPLAVAITFAGHPPPAEVLVKIGRYPVLSAWAHVAAAFSPLHFWPGLRPWLYEEALYRIVPFAAALAFSGWALRLVPGSTPRRVLAALCLSTPPLLLYYATALYLELPAVVLITMGLYGLDLAARRELGGRRETAGALLLIALGLLLKETTVVLGLSVAATVGLWAVERAPRRARLLRAARIALVVLLPLAIYLAWRLLSPAVRATRAASFDPAGLAAFGQGELYARLGRALVTEMGPGLLTLAALGVIAAVRRRRRAALVWTLTALSTLVFLAGTDARVREDGSLLPPFWGHSRLVLLLVPPLWCFALEAFRLRGPLRPVVGTVAAAALVSHVVLRPIGWDGSRPVTWGDVVAETAGERYPYDELYRWVAAAGVRGEVLVLGRDYPYPDEFYLRRHGLAGAVTVRAPRARSPRSLDLRRGNGVAAATREVHADLLRVAAEPVTPTLIVAHLRGGAEAAALPPRLGAPVRLRTFALGAHVLVVYGNASLGEPAPQARRTRSASREATRSAPSPSARRP